MATKAKPKLYQCVHHHNRIKSKVGGHTLPTVWKSKCDALTDFRKYVQGNLDMVELLTVWERIVEKKRKRKK